MAKPTEDTLYGRAAHVGAGPRQIGVAEGFRQFPNRRENGFRLGAVAGSKFSGSAFEFAVGAKEHHPQKVFPPGQQRVCALVPPLRGLVKRVVVTFPLPFYQMLQADVPTDFEAGLVEEK